MVRLVYIVFSSLFVLTVPQMYTVCFAWQEWMYIVCFFGLCIHLGGFTLLAYRGLCRQSRGSIFYAYMRPLYTVRMINTVCLYWSVYTVRQVYIACLSWPMYTVRWIYIYGSAVAQW